MPSLLPYILSPWLVLGVRKAQFACKICEVFNSVVSSRQFEVLDGTKTISDATLSAEEFLKTKQTVVFLDGSTDGAGVICVSIALPGNMDIKSYLFGCKPIRTAKHSWIRLCGNGRSFERRLKQFSAPHSSGNLTFVVLVSTLSSQAHCS